MVRRLHQRLRAEAGINLPTFSDESVEDSMQVAKSLALSNMLFATWMSALRPGTVGWTESLNGLGTMSKRSDWNIGAAELA
jgi:hypothetical protein